jgi:hypothetical protein
LGFRPRVASALCGDPLYKNSTPGFDFSLCVCPAAHTSTARELALFKTTLNIRHLFLKTRGAEVRGLGSAPPRAWQEERRRNHFRVNPALPRGRAPCPGLDTDLKKKGSLARTPTLPAAVWGPILSRSRRHVDC